MHDDPGFLMETCELEGCDVLQCSHFVPASGKDTTLLGVRDFEFALDKELLVQRSDGEGFTYTEFGGNFDELAGEDEEVCEYCDEPIDECECKLRVDLTRSVRNVEYTSVVLNYSELRVEGIDPDHTTAQELMESTTLQDEIRYAEWDTGDDWEVGDDEEVVDWNAEQ